MDRPDPLEFSVHLLEIFISSPIDVLPEREIAERVIARLTACGACMSGCTPSAGSAVTTKPRKASSRPSATCAFDLVVGILWKRVGSPLPPDQFLRADGTSYESGTVFELESAIAASEKEGKPLVYLFRKTAPVQFSANTVDEDRRQHDTLLAWWKRTVRDAGAISGAATSNLAIRRSSSTASKLCSKSICARRVSFRPARPGISRPRARPFPVWCPMTALTRPCFSAARSRPPTPSRSSRLRRTASAPVLLVVGPSGSGKSSLARAGLMPQFTGRKFRASISGGRSCSSRPPILFLPLRSTYTPPMAFPELAEGPQQTPESFAALGAPVGGRRRPSDKMGARSRREARSSGRSAAAGCRSAGSCSSSISWKSCSTAPSGARSPSSPAPSSKTRWPGSSPPCAAIATRTFSAMPISSN